MDISSKRYIGDVVSARRSIDAEFGCDAVERHVPPLSLQCRYALKVVCDTEQSRFAPVVTVAQIGERAIVKAAAHAETVARDVEGDQRHQHEIEYACVDDRQPRAYGFRYAEDVGCERVAGVIRRKAQALVRHDDGQITLLAHGPRAFQQRVQGQFAVAGEIEGDVSATAKQRIVSEQAGERGRGVVLLFSRKVTAPLAHRPSQSSAGREAAVGGVAGGGLINGDGRYRIHAMARFRDQKKKAFSARPSSAIALEPFGSSGNAMGVFRLSAVADMHTDTDSVPEGYELGSRRTRPTNENRRECTAILS